MVAAMKYDSFVEAVHDRSRDGIEAALAPDVRFLSPVVFSAYEGREVVTTIIAEGAMKVFEDFEYVHMLEQGDVATLIFRASVGGRELDGLDLLSFDEAGLIREFKVMVRPMSGLHALAEAMGKRFEALGLVPPKA
jgi:hypothetical protein